MHCKGDAFLFFFYSLCTFFVDILADGGRNVQHNNVKAEFIVLFDRPRTM
jgi:hypothetical protein